MSLTLQKAISNNQNENLHEFLCKTTLAFQTPQGLENLLRQDNYNQQIMQSCLRLYKLCRFQPQVCQSLDRIGLLESVIFLSPLVKFQDKKELIDTFISGVLHLGDVVKIVVTFTCGYFPVETLTDLLERLQLLQLEYHTIFFLLHLLGFDKALGYQFTIEKFCDKNAQIKSSKFYTQIMKNKESLEALSVLTGENLIEGFKQRIQKPEKEEIVQLIQKQAKFNANPLIEYIAINDPTLFYRSPYTDEQLLEDYLVLDQKLMMIVLRSVAEKGASELIEEYIKKSIEQMVRLDSLEEPSDQQDKNEESENVNTIPSRGTGRPVNQTRSCTLLRNYYNGLLAILMLNPQKFQKLIHNQLQSMASCKEIFQANSEATLITQILLCSFSIYETLTEYSLNLKNLMEVLNKSSTYIILCENKTSGDLGINITDEKQFLDAIRYSIEILLKQDNIKVLFQSETYTKIVSQTSKQNQIVHNDKWFKGFALIKVLTDIGNEIQNISEELMNVRPWALQELEFRVELLPAEQASKQSLMLLQQSNIDNDERCYKYLFKLPIGLIKNESNQNIFYYPSPVIQQSQIDAAKSQVVGTYIDKFLKADLITLGQKFGATGIQAIKDYFNLQMMQLKKRIPPELLQNKRNDIQSRFQHIHYSHYCILKGENDMISSDPPIKGQHSLKINWDGINSENILKIQNAICGLTLHCFTDVTKLKTHTEQLLDLKMNTSFFGLMKVHQELDQLSQESPSELWNQLKSETPLEYEYNGQIFELPLSNYQIRQRKTNLKLRLENEVAFPEFFFGFIQSFYQFNYTLLVMNSQEMLKRSKPLNILSAAIFDLYNLSALTADKFRMDKENKDLIEPFIYNVNWPTGLFEEDLKDYKESEILKSLNSGKDYREFKQLTEFHPILLINQMDLRFQQFGFKTSNILSFIETLFLKVANIYEKANKPIKLFNLIDLCLQWPLLSIITRYIDELLEQSNLNNFNAVYLECNEIDPKKCYDSKNLTTYLEGMDLIFRMGQTNFYIHYGILVVRLNIATVRTDFAPIESQLHRNMKVRESSGSSVLFQENSEIRNYINSIVTKESLLKQVLQKK